MDSTAVRVKRRLPLLVLLLLLRTFAVHCKVPGAHVQEEVDDNLLDPVQVADAGAEKVDVIHPRFVDAHLDYLGSHDPSYEEPRAKKSPQTPVCIQSRCLDLLTGRTYTQDQPMVQAHPFSITVVNLQPQDGQQGNAQPPQQRNPLLGTALGQKPSLLGGQDENRSILSHLNKKDELHKHLSNIIPTKNPLQPIHDKIQQHFKPSVAPEQNKPPTSDPTPPASDAQAHHPPPPPQVPFNYNPTQAPSPYNPAAYQHQNPPNAYPNHQAPPSPPQYSYPPSQPLVLDPTYHASPVHPQHQGYQSYQRPPPPSPTQPYPQEYPPQPPQMPTYNYQGQAPPATYQPPQSYHGNPPATTPAPIYRNPENPPTENQQRTAANTEPIPKEDNLNARNDHRHQSTANAGPGSQDPVIASPLGPSNFFENITPVDPERNEQEMRSHEKQPLYVGMIGNGRFNQHPWEDSQLGPGIGQGSVPHNRPVKQLRNAPDPFLQTSLLSPEMNYYQQPPASITYPLRPPYCDCGNTFNIYQAPATNPEPITPFLAPTYPQPTSYPQTLPSVQQPLPPPPIMPPGNAGPAISPPQDYSPPITNPGDTYAPQSGYTSYQPAQTIPCPQSIVIGCTPTVQEVPCQNAYYDQNPQPVPEIPTAYPNLGYYPGPVTEYHPAPSPSQPQSPPPAARTFEQAFPNRHQQLPASNASPRIQETDRQSPGRADQHPATGDNQGRSTSTTDNQEPSTDDASNGEQAIVEEITTSSTTTTTTSTTVAPPSQPRELIVPGGPFGMGWQKRTNEPAAEPVAQVSPRSIFDDIRGRLKLPELPKSTFLTNKS